MFVLPGLQLASTAVKVCGLTRPQDMVAAVSAGATAVGLIFAANSRRRVDIPQAAGLRTALSQALAANPTARPNPVLCVGVFSDESPRTMAEITRAVGLDALQLHGDEPPEVAGELAVRLSDYQGPAGLPILIAKAVTATEPSFVETLAHWASRLADCQAFTGFLLDRPRTTRQMGQPLDWSMLAKARAAGRLPPPGRWTWGLAGGLTAANVTDAIRQTSPQWVDVAGGVEVAAGIKDSELLDGFCRSVREAPLPPWSPSHGSRPSRRDGHRVSDLSDSTDDPVHSDANHRVVRTQELRQMAKTLTRLSDSDTPPAPIQAESDESHQYKLPHLHQE